MQKEQLKTREVPRYELTERAYIDDTLMEPGTEIEYEGLPGAHMKPINGPAKQMVREHAPLSLNPIERLTTMGANAELATGYGD